MNKEELIEKARECILKGEKKVDGYYIYTSKIDLDVKLSYNYMKNERTIRSSEIDWWHITRRAMLESIGGTVIDINTSDTDRGQHSVINYLSKVKLSDKLQNIIQLMLGDDIIRYKINARRIEKGISFEKANILFSKVLERYPHEESRLKVALERIVGEIK